MAKMMRFSKRYGMFFSDASNEEIVSISKELSDEMVGRIRSLSTLSIGVLAVSVAIALSLLALTAVLPINDAHRMLFLFARLFGMMLACVGTVLAYISLDKFMSAGATSSLMWRNIRETADDEKVYEQRMTIERTGKLLSIGNNDLVLAAGFDILSIVIFVVSFVVELFVENGFI